MSADNGIYILGTKKPNTEKEFEFRVVHAQSINNITWAGSPEFDDLNATIVCDYFGRSNIYTLEEARERAFELEEEVLSSSCPILKYGIHTMYFNTEFPVDYYN